MKKFLDKFTKLHFFLDVGVLTLLLTLMLLNWGSMEAYVRVSYLWLCGMCLHQLEEYWVPGGFVWGFNLVFQSNDPKRYPGNRLSASSSDVIIMLLTTPLLVFHCTPWLAAVFAIFGVAEIVVHSIFSIYIFCKYRNNGKTTPYFPGDATCFFIFVPTSIVLFRELLTNQLLTSVGWWSATITVLIFGFGVMGGLLLSLRDRNSPYTYKMTPTGGYFNKFIK